MSKPKQLYVKIEEEFHEVAGLLFDKGLREVKITTIEQAIDKYIECCTSNKCEKNQYSEKLYFHYLLTFFKSKKLSNIDEVQSHHMDQFESSLLKRMKASSCNRRFNTIKNFFKKCLEWEMIHKDPCKDKRKRKEEENPPKAWTFEVFQEFILTCDGVYKNIFVFLWLTGCRPMELKNLKWTDINYDEKSITLRSGKNAGVARIFPLTEELDKFLHSIKLDSHFVFTDNKKQINNDLLYHYCKKRLKALGFGQYSTYGIRHGFGTKFAKEGVSAFYIAQLMGHSKLETTKKYIHSERKELIDILSKAN